MSDLEKFARIYRDIDRMSGVVDALAAREFAAMRTGSGAPTLSAAESVLYWDTANDALYANADGATSWVFLAGTAGAGAHLMFSASHPDSVPQVAVVGGMMYGNGTPAWDVLAHPGTAGHALVSGTATFQWDDTPDWTGRHRFGDGLTITGGIADLDGRDLVIDEDGDTYLDSPSDDRARFVIPDGGRFDIIINAQDIFYFNQTALTLQTDLWIGATGKGFVHTDGVTAGLVFVADGTRFLPVAVSGDLTLAATGAAEVVAIWGYAVQDHAPEDGEALIWNTGNSRYEPGEAGAGLPTPTGRGYILRSNATPAFVEYLAKTKGAVLIGDGVDVVSDTTPTLVGNLTFDDEVGDSPAVVFRGGATDDEATIYLTDIGVVGRCDLLINLPGNTTECRLIIRDNAPASISFIDALGLASFAQLSVGGGVDAQIDVDQASSTGAMPVAKLDQGDVSEQCIEFSSDDTDRDINLWTVKVTGTPTLTWDESEDGLSLNKKFIVTSGISNFSAASLRLEMDTTNVTDDGPTDSELDSIFGTPATVGAGFVAFVLDEGVRLFGCASTGSEWYWQRWFLTAS